MTGAGVLYGRVLNRGAGGVAGIPGVAVSDGASVVLTDSEGRYILDAAPGADFVWISIPAGYRIPVGGQSRARFYHPLAEGAAPDFHLEPAPEAAEQFCFAYVTDMHLDNDPEDRFARETLTSVGRLEPPPEFVLFGGDISLQGKAEERFLRSMSGLRMPCFSAVGNHELLVGQPDPKARFKELFGPTYYSFNRGRFHFVVMDGTRPEPSRQGWKNVVGEVGARELGWLERDLHVLPPGTPVILFSHIPLVSTYSERRGLLSETAEPAWEITNAAEVLAVLERSRVPLVLQGHMHENEHRQVGSIHFLTSGSAAGKWWRGENPDDCPRGYRVIRIDGDRWKTQYVCTSGRPGAVMEVQVGSPQERMGRPVLVDVNVFDGWAEEHRVLCQAGDRTPWELAPMAGVLHRWTGYVPLGEFETRHRLTVILLQKDQEVAREVLDLEVAPWSPGH